MTNPRLIQPGLPIFSKGANNYGGHCSTLETLMLPLSFRDQDQSHTLIASLYSLLWLHLGVSSNSVYEWINQNLLLKLGKDISHYGAALNGFVCAAIVFK